MELPVAVSSSVSKNEKKTIHIKLCYLSKHPHCKDTFWRTKIVRKISSDSLLESDIIDIYCQKYDIPYLNNIKRGEVIAPFQARVLKDKLGIII